MPTDLDIGFAPSGDAGAELGESPFWDHGDCIWWVDIAGRRLLRTRLSTRETQSWPTPETPGFVVLAGPERPMVGMERGIYAFAPADGRFERLVTLDRDGQRFNDATVDHAGRLWASTMAMDAEPGRGALHVVAADLSLRTALTDLSLPNGLAADPDGGRLLVSDSHPRVQTIWTAAFDAGSGGLAAPVGFASMRQMAGRPDGAAMAADGRYWVAGVDGAALYGFNGEGRVEITVPLPFPAPTKLAFFDGGVAVTAKNQGGYDGQLAIAVKTPADLTGPAVPFWRPGGRLHVLQ